MSSQEWACKGIGTSRRGMAEDTRGAVPDLLRQPLPPPQRLTGFSSWSSSRYSLY